MISWWWLIVAFVGGVFVGDAIGNDRGNRRCDRLIKEIEK